MSWLHELKRRHVIRVGIAYLVASWLLLQVVDVVGPILRLPESFARYLLFLLVIGLLPALVFAWVFEWTPKGVRRASEADRTVAGNRRIVRKLDRAIMVILALAVGVLLFDKLALENSPEKGSEPFSSSHAEAPNTSSRKRALTPFPVPPKSVAVLPFVAMSSGPDDDYFSDGLTEEIINALAQVPGLLVTARTSAFHFKGQNLPVADIAGQLGVAHIVEGSVRRAGEQLRITAQLIRAPDGFHLWSESYDRRTEDTFNVQADIAEKVTQALNIFMDDALRERMQRVGTRNVDAFIAYQKGIEFYERAHLETNQVSLLRQANIHFEHAVELAPDFFPAYVFHTDLFSHILLTHAAGELDGDITESDVANAPGALASDYEQAMRYARNGREHASALYDRALLLGPWRGLAALTADTASSPGCEPPVWLNMASPFSAQSEAILDAFRRATQCDPMRGSAWMGEASLYLWLGQPAEALAAAEAGLQRLDHPLLARLAALALAFSGEAAAAEEEAGRRLRVGDDLALARAMLAAIRGDDRAAEHEQENYLSIQPSDRNALVLEALRGRRNEANRLAALIDSRTFGHLALLQAAYLCFCGAPFDLQSAPVFASMLAESGLAWPPPAPYDLPLKNW